MASSTCIIDDSDYNEKDYSWNQEDLEAFKEMIASEESLHSEADDLFLLGFLRARKFDLERSLQLFKSYSSVRSKFDIFRDFSPSQENIVLDSKLMGYMEKTDQDGRVIMISKTWDPSIITAKQYTRCILMYTDILLTTHVAQENGICMIFDAQGYSASNITQLTPRLIYETVSGMIGSYQCRWKEFHMVNTTGILHTALSLFMPLLPSKIRSRIIYHSTDMESLHKYIHPKYLPEEFGGELPPFDAERSNEVLRAHEQFFKRNERYWRTVELTKL